MVSKDFLRFKASENSKFVCALCHAERVMKHKRNLSYFNYIQLALVLVVTSYFLYPILGLKVLGLNFLLWSAAEFTNKLMYRKELPCKLCGFDALWYRRDPKVARRKVEECIERAKLELNLPKPSNQDHLEPSAEA